MTNFPTGKSHVSFSEIKTWKECSWRHKLSYIDKLDSYEDNPYADFGTALHNTIEKYLKTKQMDFDFCYSQLDQFWNKGNYDSEEYNLKMKDASWWKGQKLPIWKDYAAKILTRFPSYMSEQFGDWELIDAEHELYENIDQSDIKFKGFVDCIIKTKNSKGKDEIWIIDWKTTGASGWDGFKQPNGKFYAKKSDFTYTSQIGFYKKFISEKLGIDLKDIKCAFIFLKRGTTQEKSIDILKVSAGPKFIEKVDKLLKQMINMVNKGMYFKNQENCKYCPFANSEHCNGHKDW